MMGIHWPSLLYYADTVVERAGKKYRGTGSIYDRKLKLELDRRLKMKWLHKRLAECFLQSFMQRIDRPRDLLRDPPYELLIGVRNELRRGHQDRIKILENPYLSQWHYIVDLTQIETVWRHYVAEMDFRVATQVVHQMKANDEGCVSLAVLQIEMYRRLNRRISETETRQLMALLEDAGLVRKNGHARRWGRDIL